MSIGARRSGTSSDITFVDVAMALLGPFAILMIVFMVVSGLYLKAKQNCQAIDPVETQIIAEKLEQWSLQAKDLLLKAKGIPQNCKNNPQAMEQLQSVFNARFPPNLNGICHDNLQQIFNQTGIKRKDFTQLKTEFMKAVNQATHCLTQCNDLSEKTKQQKAFQLLNWKVQIRLENKLISSKLKKQGCKNRHSRILNQEINNVLEIPPLKGLCLMNAVHITEKDRKLSLESLNQLYLTNRALKEQYANCLEKKIGQQVVEPITLNWPQFRSCSVSMLKPPNGISINDEFIRIVASVENKLAQGVFNRIDIFGHTDSRPIQGECPNLPHITNNERLSSLRSHIFLEKLSQTVKRHPKNYPRLNNFFQPMKNNKIYRIYAIGVGDGEPLQYCLKNNESCHQNNRRIEIQVAFDQRINKLKYSKP